ncbi:metallophosphoesterase [Nocardioides marmoriginsengisoli]|uniref:Metallophosphoesterase n=1 Tax=Nocardioides marmoriginsengisoli TaxID=661483 RepID=A0A3N0CFC9_9ACTN|nr:metallophosphoesterase [Nocardioides marmoriginsengisoli]RNL62164.1 metallophosphoesterase [Nocardioides marmoriginsengisoli]
MSSRSRLARTVGRTVGLGALAGIAGIGYAVAETRNFTTRHFDITCLPAGSKPIRVLHLSDLHLTPSQGVKRRWIASLADLEPDLVVNTGDNLAHMDSVGPLLQAFGPLRDVPGVFVLGSNDYYAPKLRNPLWYLMPDDGERNTSTPELPWKLLKEELSQGWLDLTNTSGRLEVNGSTLAFAGVDDPHLEYDDLAAVAGPAPSDADLRIGVAHAPYLRVLDQYAADGYDVTLAGHTHGGQLCLPVKGALVTNCDLEPARAKGLHRHPADSRPGDPGSSWLHVSAGAGTSPYAQIRFCCRPEASLLTLLPAKS